MQLRVLTNVLSYIKNYLRLNSVVGWCQWQMYVCWQKSYVVAPHTVQYECAAIRCCTLNGSQSLSSTYTCLALFRRCVCISRALGVVLPLAAVLCMALPTGRSSDVLSDLVLLILTPALLPFQVARRTLVWELPSVVGVYACTCCCAQLSVVTVARSFADWATCSPSDAVRTLSDWNSLGSVLRMLALYKCGVSCRCRLYKCCDAVRPIVIPGGAVPCLCSSCMIVLQCTCNNCVLHVD